MSLATSTRVTKALLRLSAEAYTASDTLRPQANRIRTYRVGTECPPYDRRSAGDDADQIPNCCQIASTFAFTSGAITIGVPHSRLVSPGHLLVASMPILLPSPLIGEAKSR